jgi:hypothetical protein
MIEFFLKFGAMGIVVFLTSVATLDNLKNNNKFIPRLTQVAIVSAGIVVVSIVGLIWSI